MRVLLTPTKKTKVEKEWHDREVMKERFSKLNTKPYCRFLRGGVIMYRHAKMKQLPLQKEIS